tara:strand:- start:220 stop:396 length:177 start_codon:yes stop_codon:yes gene_type:complete
MIETDTVKLKENISASGLKVIYIVNKLNIGKTTFHRRVNEGKFKKSEIKVLKQLKLIK